MQKANYIVDNLNRPIRVVYPNGRATSYIYDDVGNIARIVDSATGSITFQYDLLDRLIKVAFQNGKVFSYAYDPVGNRKMVTYPNGEVVYYNYNKNNWLTEIIAGSKATRFEYDKVGRLVKKILPNGITVTYTYSSAGRLIRLVTTGTNNSTLFDFSYTLDAVGNYLEIDSNSGTLNRKTRFTYDLLYHLIGAKYPNGNKIRYEYDAMGNRLSMKSSSLSNNSKLSGYLAKTLGGLGILWNEGRYTYNSESLLIKAGKIEFKYDDNGNLIEKKVGDKTTRYAYDYENRPVKIEYPDGTYSQYAYDALGRRINKRYPNGKIIYYIYDGLNLIQEIDATGQVIASYVYELGIDHPISMRLDGNIYYYLYDHLGSVIALTDEEGNIVNEYEYDAWGNITKEIGNILNPFRFTGREWDDESGFYCYRARYYDPVIGRFISKDPVTNSSLNLLSQNRYIYVNNNPQRYTDPLGLFPNPICEFFSNLLGPTADALTNFLTGVGSASAATWGKFLGGAGTVVGFTDFLPHLFNPDHVAGFTSSVHTGTSMVGSMYGAGVGTALGAGVSVGTALMTGGAVAGLSIGAPAIIAGAVGAMAGGWAFNHLGRFITNTINTGGQNILNAVQPHVGGVLFDKAAEVLTELEEIIGAYWDDKLGQVVLVGKKNGKMEERYLPRMDKDHLAVAMRAVFSGDNLGVSIDPPPSYLEDGEFPPDETKMLVRYLGNTKNTLFGAIMFEADKLLKNLSMGIDNDTREEVTSSVSDFQNELDLSLRHGTEKKKAWHRMWFVIEDMRLDIVVKETGDRNALVFGKATLRVKAEYISKDKKKNPGVDPTAERFAKHFTLHFDEFAKEFPVLERLRELAKISAIVKWLRSSGKPVDLSFLKGYEFIEVPTPEDTPGITASKSKSKSWQDGDVTHTQTQTYSLFGGVDFGFKYQPVKDDGEAIALKKITQGSKPCETALTWDFKFKEAPQKVLAFPAARTNGNYTTIHTDLVLPATDGIKLELARCYDSFNSKSSGFGYGWNLKIPYEIFIINRQKANSPILLINRITGKSDKYMFVEDKQGYFLVHEEKEEGNRTSFTYNPQQFIRRNADGNFIWKSEDNVTYNFDPQGRLTFITDKNNRKLDYTYEGNRVVKILDSSGKSIRLAYDYKGRVKQAICPGQRVINYQYDPSNDLIRVTDNQGYVRNYTYNAYHHLTRVMDTRGKVILRNSYDSLGRVIRKRQDVVTDMEGNLIIKTYDDSYKPIKEEDKTGNTVAYEYDRENNLSKTILTDKEKRTTVFEHDKNERIKKIINPLNHSVRFNYDTLGNVTSFIDANNNIMSFEYDEDGNPLAIQDAMGNRWRQEFDHFSRRTSIIDPLGNKVEFAYIDNDNRLSSITTPEGSIQYLYDKKGRLTKLIDLNGNPTEFVYGHKGNMVGVKDALGGITSA